MDNSFEIGSKKFKVSKINAMKQFHVVRRMAPILGELAPHLKTFAKFKDVEKMDEESQFEAIGALLKPVMDGFSKLSDKDSELVLCSLLESIEIQQEQGNWAKVARDGQIMFDTLELPVLLQAAGRAFIFNLSGFFAVLPQVS